MLEKRRLSHSIPVMNHVRIIPRQLNLLCPAVNNLGIILLNCSDRIDFVVLDALHSFDEIIGILESVVESLTTNWNGIFSFIPNEERGWRDLQGAIGWAASPTNVTLP
jgi:hypothetical protein